MLEAPDVKTVISAMRPLWENTPFSANPRSPNPLDPDDLEALENLWSEDPARAILGRMYFRVQWVTCQNRKPDGDLCGKQWNALVESEGRQLCVACLDAEQASNLRQRQLGEYLQKTIGPWGVAKYSFDSFKVHAGNMEAFKACDDFNATLHNLFLWGDCGTGKTHLAGAVFKRVCASGLRVRWTNPLYLGRLLKSRWPSEEDGIIEDLVTADSIFIDDVGIGRDLNQTLQLIYELTDRRRAQGRNGMVITSNESLEALAAKYKDDRIISRISGLCRVIPMIDATDHRTDWQKERPHD